MNPILLKPLIFFAALGFAGSTFAIPTLQVGAPGGIGEGTYANYQSSLTNPIETDTAITFGNKIYVGGIYQSTDVLNLGGQYSTGDDWSDFGMPAAFDTHGAILIASVPNGAVGTLTINGQSPFHTSATNSYFPNNHDPVKSAVSDFLFFDIGTFAKSGTVPNFDSETGSDPGQIKTLMIATSGFQWIHFDVMALETKMKNGKPTTGLITGLENNPGSKDVTWKDSGGPPFGIPEPSSHLLVGLGLLGLAFARRTTIKKGSKQS
ncbi:MAG: choice-of-anchor N protein [Pseudomonadota bacterium]